MGNDGQTSARRTAFITGAASGIGRATAELLVEEGWWVGAADLNREGLDELRAGLGEENCGVWRLDVTDKSAYDAVVSELAELTGNRLDLLFNNAGIGAGGFFDDIPIEESVKVINVNLIGVLNGIYAALPLLKAAPNSLCFSTSSSAATYGPAGLAVYGATKFAVKGLTEALAVEFSRFDVRVADVLPGVIDTAIFTESPVFVAGERVPGPLATTATNAPAEGPWRLISPVAVAEAVLRCYEGDPRMHWYVPDEIQDIDIAKTADAEAMRDQRIADLQA